MDFIAGAGLILVALFFMDFSRSKPSADGAPAPRRFGLPPWLDRAVQWAIALLCLWFGALLLLGRTHLI